MMRSGLQTWHVEIKYVVLLDLKVEIFMINYLLRSKILAYTSTQVCVMCFGSIVLKSKIGLNFFVTELKFVDLNFSGLSIQSLIMDSESSPLKPHGQMNQNLVGTIYRKSSIHIAHFVPIS
jgi:hypothetical protein